MTKRYGLAVDIGTTTITAGLADIAIKKELSSLIDFNPQARFGADIISRLDYCVKNETGLQELHNAVVACVNRLIEKLLKEGRIKKSDVIKMIVVGNTAMEHFYLNVPAEKLSEAPYVSILPKGVIEAKNVWLLPIIKSFVGSDLTAGILYTRLFKKSGPELLIDIGTNGEMALAVKGNLFVTSTAAGPAFEISDKGILGSEIIDAISSMLKNGIIDKTGKLKEENKKITQNDIRRIQLAKAAIMAGMLALIKKAGVGLKDIKHLFVAGRFGNYLNKEAAINIGLLPGIELSKIKFVSNAAYKGAILALYSETAIKESEEIANKAIHLSLFGDNFFKEQFVEKMGFPI